MKYEEITQKVIGCAMDVQNCLGAGFREINYHRAMMFALENCGLRYGSEVERTIYYKEKNMGKRRLDLIIEEKVLVELKAVSELDPVCYNKILNYLKVFNIEVGLLLNFGSEKLQFKRFIN